VLREQELTRFAIGQRYNAIELIDSKRRLCVAKRDSDLALC
jgi:hypothetical protein